MAELLIDEPLAKDTIHFHDSFETVEEVGESTFDEVGDQEEEECNDKISLDQTHEAAADYDDAASSIPSTGDQEESDDVGNETVSALHDRKENEDEQENIKKDGMMSPRRSMRMGLLNSLTDEITTEGQMSHRRSSSGAVGSPKTTLHLGNLLHSMLQDEIVPTTPQHHRRSSTGTTPTYSARSQVRRSGGGTYSSNHSVTKHSFNSNEVPQLVRSSLGSSHTNSKSENSSLHSLEPPSASIIRPPVEEKDAAVQQRARRVLIDAFIDAPMMGDISLGTYLDQPNTNHNSKGTHHRRTPSSATASTFVGNSNGPVPYNDSGSVVALRRSADGFVEDDCEESIVSVLNENKSELLSKPEEKNTQEDGPRTNNSWNVLNHRRRSSKESASSTIKSPSKRIKDMVPSLKIKGIVEKVRVMGR
eukprot:CAMPEP_0198303488 /NCGR_PEP_ID=MMETSP1449-20131203/56912_1 /TAXON_ID=420275 /ORGANISM="Attheya septentrionalis, Strain CCMP2084" /LENGTH=418 /DNA_ID=CAMNT_0044005981 /DNA_START=226 /DNA_END=1479 /DNA_ORIENTATION=+